MSAGLGGMGMRGGGDGGGIWRRGISRGRGGLKGSVAMSISLINAVNTSAFPEFFRLYSVT